MYIYVFMCRQLDDKPMNVMSYVISESKVTGNEIASV